MTYEPKASPCVFINIHWNKGTQTTINYNIVYNQTWVLQQNLAHPQHPNQSLKLKTKGHSTSSANLRRYKATSDVVDRIRWFSFSQATSVADLTNFQFIKNLNLDHSGARFNLKISQLHNPLGTGCFCALAYILDAHDCFQAQRKHGCYFCKAEIPKLSPFKILWFLFGLVGYFCVPFHLTE